MFELGKISAIVHSTVGGHKVEPEARVFLRDGECLTRGSGEPENERLVGTVGGGRIEFGDPRPFVAIGSIATSRVGRVGYTSAAERRDRLNVQLVRHGLRPLRSLPRSSP